MVKTRKKDVIFVSFMFLVNCRSEEAIICEEKLGKITCPNGGLIHIAEARYGRTQSGYPKCETDKYNLSKDGPCFNNVKNLDCHLSSICKLKPENRKDPYEGDPSPGITKYLNVTYTCKMSTSTKTSAARGSTLTATEKKTQTYTTEATTTEQQTTSESTNTVSKDCRCRCSDVGTNRWEYLYKLGLTRSEMRSIMAHFLESLKQNVTIDIKATDRMYRMNKSASDDRVSAKSIGCVGVALVVTVAVSLFVLDISNIYKVCKTSRLLPKRSIGNYKKITA